MPQDETIEDLFGQFDEVVEKGAAPAAPPSKALTHSRAPSLWTRFLRWTVQGSGMLVAYLALFLAPLTTARELAGGVLGLCLVTFVVAPLIGHRPLAQPARWAALALFASALASIAAALTRWPNTLVEMHSAPLSGLVLAACSMAERATAPAFLAWATLLAGTLFWLARRLSGANPWIETRPRRRGWRRALSLTISGLVLGVTVALPVLHHVLWNQSWVITNMASMSKPATPPTSAQDDLGVLLLGPEAAENGNLRNLVQGMSGQQFLAKVTLAASYLERSQPLTVRDKQVISVLCERSLSEPSNPQLSAYLWVAHQRVYQDQLNPVMARTTTRGLRRQVFPEMGQADMTPEMLDGWVQRLDSFEAIMPMARRSTDWIFLEHLQNYSPGVPGKAASRAEFQRPLRLFGAETSWSAAGLAGAAERAVALLAYSHRRQSISDREALSSQLEPPYTHSQLFDLPLQRLFTSVKNELPYREAQENLRLGRLICDLKKDRAKNGVFPNTYSNLPEWLSYESHGATASLQTISVNNDSHLYFNGTLK